MKSKTNFLHPLSAAIVLVSVAVPVTGWGQLPSPTPGGGYRNNNTAEGTNTLFSNTTADANTAILYLKLTYGSPLTTVYGLSDEFGFFGSVLQKQGTFPFDSPGGVLSLKPFPLSGTLTAINTESWAGWFSNGATFAIAGFTYLPAQKVQFTFNLSDTSTFLVGLHHEGTVEGWYADFHLKQHSFVATPVRENGNVVGYNVVPFSVPGATQTRILTANDEGRGGDYVDASGLRNGFYERLGKLYSVPSEDTNPVRVTAISSQCIGVEVDLPSGQTRAETRCGSNRRLIVLGGGSPSIHITQVFDDGNAVGWVDEGNGSGFGYLTY